MLWWSDPEVGADEFIVEIVLLKPQSRGAVRLRSNAASDKPRITLPRPDDADVRRLSIGYAHAAELAMHENVQRFCDFPEVLTGETLTDFVRSTSFSIPHVVGTCSMGSSPEDGSVVDSKGFVHGVEGLSVIDASIIPEPLSGFPHLPTIMIAERLSHQLRS
jgi:choline dehydrogenase